MFSFFFLSFVLSISFEVYCEIQIDKMPVRTEVIPPPSQSKQLGFPKTLLYNGSKFEGSQKSKGNSYAVEVVLQVFIMQINRFFTVITIEFGSRVSF